MINGIEILTKEDEYRLAKLALAGDVDARNKVVLGIYPILLKHLASMAKQHSRSLDDLVQFAIAYILGKFDSYDPDKGRVATYFLKGTIGKVYDYVVNEDRVISLPNNSHRKQYQERSKASGGSERLEQIGKLRQQTLSLDYAPPSGEGSFLEIVVDPSSVKSSEEIDEQNLTERVRQAIERLSDERERNLVKWHMAGEKLHEMGERVGLTKERVRQLLMRAHKKLEVMLAEIAQSNGYHINPLLSHRLAKIEKSKAVYEKKNLVKCRVCGKGHRVICSDCRYSNPEARKLASEVKQHVRTDATTLLQTHIPEETTIDTSKHVPSLISDPERVVEQTKERPQMTCAACKRGPFVSLRRGLCLSCWRNPEIRSQHAKKKTGTKPEFPRVVCMCGNEFTKKDESWTHCFACRQILKYGTKALPFVAPKKEEKIKVTFNGVVIEVESQEALKRVLETIKELDKRKEA